MEPLPAVTSTTEPSSETTTATSTISGDGIHFKHFEKVVAKLLLHIQFKYVKLPPIAVESISTIPQPPPSPESISPQEGSDDVRLTNHHTIRTKIETWPFGTENDSLISLFLSFVSLPSAARVGGRLPGQLTNELRAIRKEHQIRSIIRCIRPFLIPPPQSPKNNTTTVQPRPPQYLTIVDFGGGTGHLSIPLALLFPQIRIICVDLGRHSLNLLHQKATKCCCDDSDIHRPVGKDDHDVYQSHEDMDQVLRVSSIPNLFTYYGPVHTFVHHPFDIAIALHLCGEATDVVLQLAGTKRIKAIVVAPCCVGKLSASSHNPYVYQATGSNSPTIQYPRSSLYRKFIHQADDWNALAEAADYGDTNLDNEEGTTVDSTDKRYMQKCGGRRNSIRNTAKSLLETDRCFHLQEMYGYTTVLTQMEPTDASPKNDIIVAWLPQEYPDRDISIHWKDEYSGNEAGSSSRMQEKVENNNQTNVCITKDWSKNEEEEIRQQLQDFISNIRGSIDDNGTTVVSSTTTAKSTSYMFPTGMGRRRRKLIHYVVTTEFHDQLRHWSVGKKNADKTVAVGLRSDISTMTTTMYKS